MYIYSDFKDDINAFLKSSSLWICLALVAIIVISIVIIVLVNKHDKKADKVLSQIDFSTWLTALGGKDNIEETNAAGSRLTVKLKDVNEVNKDELKELGVTNIITMSDKVVLVIPDHASKIKYELDK